MFFTRKNKFDNKPEQMSCISFSEFKNFVDFRAVRCQRQNFYLLTVGIEQTPSKSKIIPGRKYLETKIKRQKTSAFSLLILMASPPENISFKRLIG